MSAVAGEADREQLLLRLGERLGELCGESVAGTLDVDEIHGGIDEQAGRVAIRVALDLAADRVLGRRGDAGGLQRRTVRPGVAVDAVEHDRSVATRRRRDRPRSGSALRPTAPGSSRGRRPRIVRLGRRIGPQPLCRSASESFRRGRAEAQRSPSAMTWPCASIRPGSRVAPLPSTRVSRVRAGCRRARRASGRPCRRRRSACA